MRSASRGRPCRRSSGERGRTSADAGRPQADSKSNLSLRRRDATRSARHRRLMDMTHATRRVARVWRVLRGSALTEASVDLPALVCSSQTSAVESDRRRDGQTDPRSLVRPWASKPVTESLARGHRAQSSHAFAVPLSSAPSYKSSHALRTSPSTRAPGASVSLPRVVMTAPPPASPTVPQT